MSFRPEVPFIDSEKLNPTGELTYAEQIPTNLNN